MRPIALILALLPAPALACTDAVLSCQIGGKSLQICADAAALSYSFGPKDQPELTLTAAMADGPVEPWPGVGGSIWETARFVNGETTYEVWISEDRNSDDHPMDAGVNVMKGDETLAALSCDTGSLTGNGVFALSDAMAAAGFCWNLDAQSWGKDCPAP